jgi:hypothetical protein
MIYYKTNLDWSQKFVDNNIDIIEENYKRFPTRNRWNCNVHAIHDNDEDMLTNIDFMYLRREYEKLAPEVARFFDIKEYHLSDLWYNYYKEGQDQEPHMHDGEGGVTAVHYLLFDPKEHSKTEFTDGDKAPEIQQGDILFFDCFKEHYVPQNNSTKPRLTVAFTMTKHV